MIKKKLKKKSKINQIYQYRGDAQPTEGKEEKRTSKAGNQMKILKSPSNKDIHQLKLMKKKIADLETITTELKGQIQAISLKEINEKLEECSQNVEKKANAIEIKKLNNAIDTTNGRFDGINKELEGIQKAIKDAQENEELNSLKLKFSSMDSKLTVGLKSIKDLNTKVTENMMMQIVPQAQIGGDEDKKEERFNQFVDETTSKTSKLQENLSQLQTEITRISKSIDERIEEKANKEALTDLECKN